MTKKTQRMRPPTAESSRQADEYRRHREVIERLDRIDYSTRFLAVAALAAASMPQRMPMRADERIAVMKRCMTEAWAALEQYPLPPRDETS